MVDRGQDQQPFFITVEEENGQPAKQTNGDKKEEPYDLSVEKPASGDPASIKGSADGPTPKCCTKTRDRLDDCCGRMLLACVAFALFPLLVLLMLYCCSNAYITTFYRNQYRTLCCCGCCCPSRIEWKNEANGKPDQSDPRTPASSESDSTDTLTAFQRD
jgi:hypothetical protein